MHHPEDSALCQHLLRTGRVSVSDLVACAEAQRAAREAQAPIPRLWELLLARGHLDPSAVEEARAAVGGSRGRPRRRRLRSSSGRWQPGWGSREQDGVAPDDRLGTYLITDRIGCGSMGAVFAARCQRTGAVVALKVLAGDRVKRPGGVERFLREAQLLCSLRHEGLVRGIAFGVDQGRRFFAMEYFPAPSLKHLIAERGRLTQDEALTVGLQVARTLDYLHGEGIVHRDVKPANILVGPGCETRLCDLGLARDLDLPSEATSSSDTLGTPRYIAPEQARGPSAVGPRADLYSLGVTLFHAVSGRAPFPEESGIVALSRHLFDEVPDVRTARPDVSPALAAVIWRLTRRDPACRPESGAAAVSELEAAAGRGAQRRAA